MEDLKELRKVEKFADQCMKCGFCSFCCPVYQEEKTETSLARGKNYLVKQILTFSRQSEQENKPVQAGLVIKEVCKLLRASLPSTISILTEIDEDRDIVVADATQLHQIIMNLCTNAAYSMGGKKGSIDISLQGITFGSVDLPSPDMEPGEYLVLSVKDTGSGIAEKLCWLIAGPVISCSKRINAIKLYFIIRIDIHSGYNNFSFICIFQISH